MGWAAEIDTHVVNINRLLHGDERRQSDEGKLGLVDRVARNDRRWEKATVGIYFFLLGLGINIGVTVAAAKGWFN